MAGTKDIAGNAGPTCTADYQNNIIAMTTLARAHGIRVVLASVPPMHEVPWRPEVGNTLARVARLNAWLRGFAMHHDLLHVDYHARPAQPHGDRKSVG